MSVSLGQIFDRAWEREAIVAYHDSYALEGYRLLTYSGTFYYLFSIVDGYSRAIVHSSCCSTAH